MGRAHSDKASQTSKPIAIMALEEGANKTESVDWEGVGEFKRSKKG